MPYSNRLLNVLSEITNSDLKRQLEFMKAENTILRQHCLHRRIILTLYERQKLIKYGLPLGGKIKHLISIVHYSTFRRWIDEAQHPHKKTGRRGRPRVITAQLKEQIVHMARMNKWGYTKIIGELKKLAVKYISRTSVKNTLKEYGIEVFKIRSQDTWDHFLKRTFNTLWACDFFAKSVWTPFGRRLYYCLFFINVKTRHVHLAGITRRIDNQWLMEQTQKLDAVFNVTSGKAALIRDRDIKYSKAFDQFFEDKGISVMKIPPHSPNLNPYAESWVATVKRECLDHFLVIGKVHLEYLVNEFVDYYNNHRPHSGLDHDPPKKCPVKMDGEIHARPILGGLMHHYYRR
jgi:putative transposase